MTRLAAALLSVCTFASVGKAAPGLKEDGVAAAFRNPPAEARTRMFWRIFGPAWAPPEIDYQLALLREAGVGGVTVFFMYPVALDDPNQGIHNQKFLSGEFLQTLAYAARRAKELGLRFSIAGGTGWPFGGPSVATRDAAQRLRPVMVPAAATNSALHSLPALKDGESYFAAFLGSREVRLQPVGDNLAVSGSEGSTPLQVFIAGPTYMEVKRAAFGAEGLVVDHFNQIAAENYLNNVVAPMLRAAPGLIESVFCDSLEVYSANWTRDFPQVFRKRRGYDLRPLLPDLFDAAAPRAPGLRFDFWRTLSELTEERFTKFVAAWAHQHGVKFEMEAYGTPPNPLTAAQYIDVPVGEQYEWQGFSLSRLAASGAHLAGKRIIAAEAWTWVGIPNRLADSLSDLKLASDLHFLSGINDLIGVDFAYSPRSVGASGWLAYYGPFMNQNHPQWPWFRHLVDYTSRCQWLLRQGRPVADVAIYLPVEDKFASGPTDQMLLDFDLRDHFVSGEKIGEFGLRAALRHHSDLIHGLLTHGFNYDGLDFFSVDRFARVKNGRLIAGDGSYSVLILPGLAGIELEALKKVAAFCHAGGTVIATKRPPDRCYGLNSGRDTRDLRALVSEMFGPTSERASLQPFGKGRAIFVPEEAGSLLEALARLSPDLRLEPYQPEVGFVHRRDGNRDIYFLANVGEAARSFRADFRVTRGNAALWDPMTGTIRPVSASLDNLGFRTMPIQLPPRGSTFVIFDAAAPQPQPKVIHASNQIEELNLTWKLSFEGTDAPPSRVLPDLVSWTSWPEARFYSGRGTYTAEFEWKGSLPAEAHLVLSQVRDVADVILNGQPAGAIWTPPYEVEIARLLKPGTNTISVTVANLPLNRFLGAPDEDLRPLRAMYGNRFPEPSEKRTAREPIPSGLIGSIRLRVIR